jgi:hypothetical protein
VVFAIPDPPENFWTASIRCGAWTCAESASFALRNLEILLDLENEVVKVKIRVGNSGEKW